MHLSILTCLALSFLEGGLEASARGGQETTYSASPKGNAVSFQNMFTAG